MELTEEQLKALALDIIYTVDYDIGKECDPDVHDENPGMIDEVAAK